MQLKEYVPLFDNAIKNKNEVELYQIGFKVAFIYCKILQRKGKVTVDCEDWATDLILRCMEVSKETDYQKPSEYYWGILRTGAKFKYLQFLKNENVLSLDYLSTNEYGENILDRFDVQNAISERTSVEKLRTNLVNEIIEIADTFKTRNEVWEIIKLKYPEMEKPYFLRLCREYRIQFDTKYAQLFLSSMRVYNIYKMLNEDVKATRKYILENKIEHSGNVQMNVNLAKGWLDLFHNNKNQFMARFVLPPNTTSCNAKWWD